MSDTFHPAVPLADIIPSSSNPRKKFDEAELAELAASIKEKGVIQPIVIRPNPFAGKKKKQDVPWEIVAGERRWRASKLAGATTIPAMERNLDDKAVLEIQVIENLQRADVHPLEESAGFRALCEEHGYTAEGLAEKTGKSPGYIYQRLQLARLTTEAQALFRGGRIQLGHALLLARLRHEDQQAEAIDRGLFENWKRDSDGQPVVKTVMELNEWIHRALLQDLKHARWSVKDEQLLPEAGSCLGCAKRSGATPQLFPELNPKTDLCLDKACFALKLDAWIARQAQEKKAVLVTSKYGSKLKLPRAEQMPRIEKGQAAKCESSVMAVIAEGHDKGESFRTCVDPKCKIHAGKKCKTSDNPNAEELRRKKAAKLETQFRKAVFVKIREKLADTSEFGSAFFYGAPLVAIAEAVYDRLEHVERKLIDEDAGRTDQDYDRGFMRKWFESHEDERLMALVIEMAAMRQVRANAYSDSKPEELLSIAAHFGVDTHAIEVATKGPEWKPGRKGGKK